MNNALLKMEPVFYAALRVIAGFMFTFHGLGKVFGIFGQTVPMWTQVWWGGVIELVCGVLVALGLFTRPAAILASGTMAVAYWQFHVKGDFANNHWLPVVNKGEMAALYCFVFLFIAARGAGLLSADRVLRRDT